jgi:dihydroneopterin aldolase
MNTYLISVDGIAAQGRHGVNPGEKLEYQDFVADLEVTVDVDEDAIESTIDYGVLVGVTREVIERTSFDLVETLAHAIARAIFEYQNVIHVLVTVRKPGAAQALGVEDVYVQAELA